MFRLTDLLMMLASASTLLADDRVVHEYSFDLAGVSTVELLGSVGSIHVIPVKGTALRLVLEIEAQDHGCLWDSLNALGSR